jgi:hypothetical protein
MPYHIDEENSELAFEVREGNKLVIKIKSNIFSDSLELYLIKVGDNTEPTDKNVFSSLRVLKEIENLHDTILKEINSVTSGFWELKQDSQGNEYIATKYNVLTEGGLTTYGLGEQKLGTIYDGLPIDNNTIYWEEVEGSRVLKAKGSGGGSTGLDETKLWNVLGTPGDQQIDYSHLSDAFSQFSNEFVTINTEQEITALKHFTAGLSIGSAKKKIYEKDGVLYIDSNVAITGALTMYATDGQSVSSIYDGLPIDNDTIYWETVEGSRVLKAKGGSSFDENAMWSALSGSSDNQINKSHLTDALAGYATTEALNSVSNKLNDFLEGSDTDNIINKWKELEAFLSGMAETDNLAEILETKADKKYVDSTFVTLGTKQTITGEKTFSSVLNTAAIKASGEITTPSLAASDYVTIAGIKLRKLEDGALMLEGNLALTGALTMYASNGQSFDTIYDGLPIDNDTIYWQEVDGSRVLKAREGSGSSFDKSAMWNALAGGTTEQINKTHLTTALNGYATESWVTSKNYLTSVSIATISDLHANWDALLKAAPSAYVTRWPTISEVTGKQNLVVKLNGGTTEGTNQFTYNATAAKSINITASSVGAAASSHNHSWSNITSGKPTTLAGYGITDAPTKTGSGASGTWGINISGNASNADKLDNYHESSFFRARNTMNSSKIDTFALRENGTYSVGYGGYSGMLSVFKCGTGSIYSMEILSPYYETSHGLKFRYVVDGTRYTNWRSFAFEDGNVYSATKLQNKRYFWGQEFDGTTDVTGIIVAYNGIQLPYRKQIQTEYGTLLSSGYNSESGYNDFFQLTAIGANKAARSLVGGNTGKLVWEGHQFIMTTYDGGWYMSDNEWMRTYNNKGVVCNDLWIDSRVRFGGNAEFGGNNYPNGVVFYDRTRKQRGIFAWYNDHFYMAKFENNKESTGYVAIYEDYVGVGGNLLVSGGATFYSSDIRYKSIMQQVELSLLAIANAPSFVYHWNKEGMKCDRLNLGGSAQYTQSILPWAVEEKDNFLSMDYATVAYTFAVHTARHLLTYESRTDKKIKKLENRVKYLEKQLKKLGYEEVRTLDDQSV